LLTGENSPEGIAGFYRQRGAKLVIVKLGPDGAYYEGAQGAGYIPGFVVANVVDTGAPAMVLPWASSVRYWMD
jgi:dehydrogluconokinase